MMYTNANDPNRRKGWEATMRYVLEMGIVTVVNQEQRESLHGGN